MEGLEGLVLVADSRLLRKLLLETGDALLEEFLLIVLCVCGVRLLLDCLEEGRVRAAVSLVRT